jgi:hypothetical protein
MLTNCMLTNEGESICALFPSAPTPDSRGSLLILVRLPGNEAGNSARNMHPFSEDGWPN